MARQYRLSFHTIPPRVVVNQFWDARLATAATWRLSKMRWFWDALITPGGYSKSKQSRSLDALQIDQGSQRGHAAEEWARSLASFPQDVWPTALGVHVLWLQNCLTLIETARLNPWTKMNQELQFKWFKSKTWRSHPNTRGARPIPLVVGSERCNWLTLQLDKVPLTTATVAAAMITTTSESAEAFMETRSIVIQTATKRIQIWPFATEKMVSQSRRTCFSQAENASFGQKTETSVNTSLSSPILAPQTHVGAGTWCFQNAAALFIILIAIRSSTCIVLLTPGTNVPLICIVFAWCLQHLGYLRKGHLT